MTAPLEIGSRRELFVDDYLIDSLMQARLELHHPQPREVVFTFDQPWDRNCGYMTVFHDGGRYRLYYRGVAGTRDEDCVTCYANSSDGIHWTRPNLGLYAVGEAQQRENNIIWQGPPYLENMTPFLDANPACPAEQRFKAVGGVQWITGGLWGFTSPDGIHWRTLGDQPLPLAGNFDSQNVAFWDTEHSLYRAFWRDHRHTDPEERDVRTAVSSDFVHWSDGEWLAYDPGRSGSSERDQTDDPTGDNHQLYTNGVQPYYRAPHLLLGFPQRYCDRGWTASSDALPERARRRELAAKEVGGGRPTREGTAVTDVLFMTSRDGRWFSVWPEAWIRPGMQRPGAWWYDGGCHWYSCGIVETASTYAGAPPELSLYVTERDDANAPVHLRRHVLRLDGFASVNAPLTGGACVTKPLLFTGNRLDLNFSTSAGGRVQVELQDEQGRPLSGYSLDECHLLYGDQHDRIVSWTGGTDIGAFAGRPIRLRFILRDADIFAIRFIEQ